MKPALDVNFDSVPVLYTLRHTFATRIAPHLDAWTLCKIMGWASLSVAMGYIHPRIACWQPSLTLKLSQVLTKLEDSPTDVAPGLYWRGAKRCGSQGIEWWAVQDSNLRPPARKL